MGVLLVYHPFQRDGGPFLLLRPTSFYIILLDTTEDRFPADVVAAGVDGIVVPDLPPEEGTALRREARRNGLAIIPLVAPTTPPARLKTLVAEGSGFIYYVSVRGVTGAREHPAPILPRQGRMQPPV
ncbi:MAG: tryptophan synthase subunit alpha [Firmicutes bacterium]|nr:tryptophan synthase subunit alpha [Bacillota bacterium]